MARRRRGGRAVATLDHHRGRPRRGGTPGRDNDETWRLIEECTRPARFCRTPIVFFVPCGQSTETEQDGAGVGGSAYPWKSRPTRSLPHAANDRYRVRFSIPRHCGGRGADSAMAQFLMLVECAPGAIIRPTGNSAGLRTSQSLREHSNRIWKTIRHRRRRATHQSTQRPQSRSRWRRMSRERRQSAPFATSVSQNRISLAQK